MKIIVFPKHACCAYNIINPILYVSSKSHYHLAVDPVVCVFVYVIGIKNILSRVMDKMGFLEK